MEEDDDGACLAVGGGIFNDVGGGIFDDVGGGIFDDVVAVVGVVAAVPVVVPVVAVVVPVAVSVAVDDDLAVLFFKDAFEFECDWFAYGENGSGVAALLTGVDPCNDE